MPCQAFSENSLKLILIIFYLLAFFNPFAIQLVYSSILQKKKPLLNLAGSNWIP